MAAFLTVGKSSTGEFFSIDTQERGITSLTCPFCDIPLIAARGDANEHHFRHDGKTCRESSSKAGTITGWDHFHLSIPVDLIRQLQENTGPRNTYIGYSEYRSKLRRYDLIKENPFSERWDLTDTGLIVTGRMSLTKFSQWFLSNYDKRLENVSTKVEKGIMHPAHLDVERVFHQILTTSTLYFLELRLDDGKVIHKIGRTTRTVQERMNEVCIDMEAAHRQGVSVKLLNAVHNAGHVERFLLYKNRSFKYEISNFTEYLILDKKSITRIKNDMTRLSNRLL